MALKITTEKHLWTKLLRPLLHQPENNLLAYKVQDAFVKGLPDTVANLRGVVWWLELKITPSPVRATTPFRVPVTAEQRRWLKAWVRAGGNAGVLTYDPRKLALYLFDPDVPEESPEFPERHILARWDVATAGDIVDRLTAIKTIKFPEYSLT